eukprot:434752-Amphidinium_carterae.1
MYKAARALQQFSSDTKRSLHRCHGWRLSGTTEPAVVAKQRLLNAHFHHHAVPRLSCTATEFQQEGCNSGTCVAVGVAIHGDVVQLGIEKMNHRWCGFSRPLYAVQHGLVLQRSDDWTKSREHVSLPFILAVKTMLVQLAGMWQGLETDVGVHRRTQQAWSQPPQGFFMLFVAQMKGGVFVVGCCGN